MGWGAVKLKGKILSNKINILQLLKRSLGINNQKVPNSNMEDIDDTLIRYYFHLGLQYDEIHLYLLANGLNISIRTLKRRLKIMQLYRRKMYTPIETVSDFLMEQLLASGQMPGYKWMHLRCIQNGIIVKQSVVRHLMHVLDPEGMSARRRKRLRRRQYFNKGPNYLWHIDGYDKLKLYGICISGCMDGFSRKILWLRAAYSNNSPQIICIYFLETVTKLKSYPQTIRTDMGTENTLIECVQKYFHEIMNNEEDDSVLPPFLYGTSHANQRIKVWWAMLRRQNSQYWINRFQQLKEDGIFNGTIVDKSVLQYCFMDLIQVWIIVKY